jgi:hypothetical protein
MAGDAVETLAIVVVSVLLSDRAQPLRAAGDDKDSDDASGRDSCGRG